MPLVRECVSPRLDYCQSLLHGNHPKLLLDRLQRVLNTAARLVTSTPRSSYITSVLRELHWLPVSNRIRFKLMQLTCKALHGRAPVYLAELLTLYVHTYQISQVRSRAGPYVRCHPITSSLTGQKRSLRGSFGWNDLTNELRSTSRLSVFKTGLKVYLFWDELWYNCDNCDNSYIL